MARIVFGYPGVYNASSITLSDGEGAGLALDFNGHVLAYTSPKFYNSSTAKQISTI